MPGVDLLSSVYQYSPNVNSQAAQGLIKHFRDRAQGLIDLLLSRGVHPPNSHDATSPPSPFPFLLPPLPLEVNPVRVLGVLGAPPVGSGAEPQLKSNLVRFSLKIWHLCGNNFKYFSENELTKFKLCPPTSLFLSLDKSSDFCDAFCVARGCLWTPCCSGMGRHDKRLAKWREILTAQHSWNKYNI